MRRIRIEVPATSANLGPGFDTLGMALGVTDIVDVEIDEESDDVLLAATTARVTGIDPRQNLFCNSYRRWGEEHGVSLPGARFRVESRIPIARGLGSSAACIVAGLAAAGFATGERAERDRVLTLASIIEGHPDNAVAAVLGGITVAFMHAEKVHAIKVAGELPLGVAVFVPQSQLLTAEARATLPDSVSLQDAIFDLGRVAYLAAAFGQRRWEALGTAMEDRLHQPHRLRHVPALNEIIVAAREAGAYGAALSGSGPSVLALGPPADVDSIASAMERTAEARGCPGQSITTGVRPRGYEIVELE